LNTKPIPGGQPTSTVTQYENFPVASWLSPRQSRGVCTAHLRLARHGEAPSGLVLKARLGLEHNDGDRFHWFQMLAPIAR
jgi:hypothetical protein